MEALAGLRRRAQAFPGLGLGASRRATHSKALGLGLNASSNT